MRRVLITGGTGFIGSRLALRHLEGGDAVRILAQLNTPAEKQNAEMLQRQGAEMQRGSVTDRDAVCSAVADVDTVFHLAAAQHEANVAKQHFYDVNVDGTRILLEACAAAGVGRVVHGSTIGVYGTERGGPVHEDSPLTPENIYGITKLAGEDVVHEFGRELPTTIVRISETYGPGDRRLLKLFRGVATGRFFMIGPGDNLHHLICIDDLIDGMQAAASEAQAIGEIVVLVGPEAITTWEMVVHVAAAVGKKPPWLRLPLGPLMLLATTLEFILGPVGVQPPLHRRRMNFFVKSFKFGGDKARAVLNFQPKIGFGRGAELTAAWYRDEGLLS